MKSVRCTFFGKNMTSAGHETFYNALSESAVHLPLLTLGRDVTHLFVKVGAGGRLN